MIAVAPEPLFAAGGDAFSAFHPLLAWIFPHYVAYSAYDAATMFVQGEQHWSMWAHHAAGAMGACCMIVFRRGAFFTLWGLLTELTAVTNNALWFAQHPWPLYVAVARAGRRKRGPSTSESRSRAGSGTGLRPRRPSDAAPGAPDAQKPAAPGPPAVAPLATSDVDEADGVPKRPPTPAVLRLLAVRAASFLLVRLWVMPYAAWRAVREAGGWGPLGRQLAAQPWPVIILCPTLVLVFGILNVLWTVAVCRIWWRGRQRAAVARARRKTA